VLTFRGIQNKLYDIPQDVNLIKKIYLKLTRSKGGLVNYLFVCEE